MTSSSLSDALAIIVGHHFVADDAATCAQFAVQGCVPACVVAPETIEELAAVMAAAHTQNAVVVPWGGGTQQWIGYPPQVRGQGSGVRSQAVEPRTLNPDPLLVVRSERINRVRIYEPDDLTISVEAGITWGALRTLLAARGQMLPFDPPLSGQATVGGLIATAMDGPRRLGYGTLRDLLIGVTVVEASGRVSKAGGMVVKNVSGFDMMKLYHGSFGSLAMIAVANFKLLPAPRAATLLLCNFPLPVAAFAFLDTLHASQLTPAAAEYLNQEALTALGQTGACAVAVFVEGLPQAVDRHTRDIAKLAAEHSGTAQAAPDAAVMLARIADLPQVAQLAPDEAVVKLATLPSELAAALARLELLGGAPLVSARALQGVAYARFRNTSARQLAQLAAELPGMQWIATPIEGVPRWGTVPAGIELMQRLKTEFDPTNTLNRGRFVV